jgi:Ca-activated chloride channel family protein
MVNVFRVKYKIILSLTLISALAAFITLKPNSFINLWLTKDQQGQLLFNFGMYEQASNTFNNVHWKAFSAYGNENYETAATFYSQFDNKESLLSQANALAHGRNYLKARDLYQKIIDEYPNFSAAKQNRDLVQGIIDEVNLLSQAQQPEQGESIKELGDEPQTGDGADKKESRLQKIDQFTSEQLLLDPNLNDMWLRQVQKSPDRFLSQKFYFQYEKRKQNKVKAND